MPIKDPEINMQISYLKSQVCTIASALDSNSTNVENEKIRALIKNIICSFEQAEIDLEKIEKILEQENGN